MASAKVIIREQDRSAIVPSFPGVYGGIALAATKGPVGVPFLTTGETELLNVFGDPIPSVTGFYSAIPFLGESNKLWTVRVAHADVKYGGAYVRSEIDPVPLGIPAPTYTADVIVKPTLGMTQAEVDALVFPLYASTRVYSQALATVAFDASTNVVKVTDLTEFEVNDKISFDIPANLSNDSDYFVISNKLTEVVPYDKVVLSAAVTAPAGTQITDDLAASITGAITVRAVTASNEILVENSDLIYNGATIIVNGTTVTVLSKEIYNETQHSLILSNIATVTTGSHISIMTQSEFEERDSFYVYGANQGEWNNNISIGIGASTNYDNAFWIYVYENGVEVESYEVTKVRFVNGNGRQMHLEDRINGKSSRIKVKDNPFNPNIPLPTTYSLWRRDPDDIFNPSGLLTTEDLVRNDVEIRLDGSTLSIGDRIKFGTYLDEYKVLDKVGNIITIDRGIQVDRIIMGSVVKRFDPTLNDAVNGIVNGVQYYAVSRLDKVYPTYPINSTLIISGVTGKLLDSGFNLLTGGHNGSPVTLSDMINGINLLGNKESTPVSLIMDGGYTHPAYAQAIHEVCKAQNLTHGFLSCDPSAEESTNYKTEIVNYKNSLNLNTEKCSLFTGWVEVFDSYNQTTVMAAPDGFAAAAQAFTAREYQMFYPAAGWTRGKFEALGMLRKFSEGDRDYFVGNRINPIRYKSGSGLAIWGNETLLSKPSPLQLRSVAMLLIVIKYGLENFLEFDTFELNNPDTWDVAEGALNAFMRDEIKGKGGVYDYQVAITDIITPSDLDNRRMPVFLGIKPTMDIKEIPVTLGIFNSSVDIQVAV